MKPCCKAFLSEQFGGDEDIVAEIYAEYVTSLHAKAQEAADRLAAADWQRLDETAHTIKGNALVAGDTETADAAIALRGASKLGDSAKAGELVARIRELAAQL